MYIGQNHSDRLWLKAVPEQPSFYDVNFTYQLMLPLISDTIDQIIGKFEVCQSTNLSWMPWMGYWD